MTNKDLDLPTQQELLAQFRCDEIAVTAFNQFTNLLAPIKSDIETGSVLTELGSQMERARATSIGVLLFHPGFHQPGTDTE